MSVPLSRSAHFGDRVVEEVAGDFAHAGGAFGGGEFAAGGGIVTDRWGVFSGRWDSDGIATGRNTRAPLAQARGGTVHGDARRFLRKLLILSLLEDFWRRPPTS